MLMTREARRTGSRQTRDPEQKKAGGRGRAQGRKQGRAQEREQGRGQGRVQKQGRANRWGRVHGAARRPVARLQAPWPVARQ
jgi:hypothetical protein